jgi:hypothetical protein
MLLDEIWHNAQFRDGKPLAASGNGLRVAEKGIRRQKALAGVQVSAVLQNRKKVIVPATWIDVSEWNR